MTEKLYYKDAYLFSFSAVVTEILAAENLQAVILDRTAFFPEGGGQPGDAGQIGTVPVSDTRIVEGKILHIVPDASVFQVGDAVSCILDFQKRFARMQAHSGEHIFSGLAHRLYGAENVGFHMDDTVMTVDFDKPLCESQIDRLEREANAVVWQNRKIRCFFPSQKELPGLVYRSKLTEIPDLRLVEIEDCDLCACCAPHVASTGEIGLIKVLHTVRHRGGVRILLSCGSAAYDLLAGEHRDALRISALLKVKPEEIGDGVASLSDKCDALRKTIASYRRTITEYIDRDIPSADGNIVYLTDGFDADSLRRLADRCKGKCGGVFVALSRLEPAAFLFAVGSEKEIPPELRDNILHALNGKGGGRGTMLQGTFYCELDRIRSYFQIAESRKESFSS